MTNTDSAAAKAPRKTSKPATAILEPAKPSKKNAPPAQPKAPTKIENVVAMLRREEGATIAALMEATGWQAHSVRGIIAGSIKKKLGLAVTSETGETGRTYRIVEEAAA